MKILFYHLNVSQAMASDLLTKSDVNIEEKGASPSYIVPIKLKAPTPV